MTKVLYAVVERLSDRVKIGRSSRVFQRLSELQTGSAEPLDLLATSSKHYSFERRIHRKLSGFRLEGEWFAPEVTAAIREAKLLGGFASWLDDLLAGTALLTRVVEYPIATADNDLCRVLVREHGGLHYAKR